MKITKTLIISLLFFIATTLITCKSWGKADPAWLKSWNEAQKSRPVSMGSNSRIATEQEPGTPLTILGQVFEPDNTPAPGVVVHAYHRDHQGLDFGPHDNTLTTWRLQGWVMSDANGRFKFQTIRPRPDHLGREGAHIHLTVESQDYGRQWAPTVFLSDDPLVTAKQRRKSKAAGAHGWVRAVNSIDGVQHLEVSIKLKKQADF